MTQKQLKLLREIRRAASLERASVAAWEAVEVLYTQGSMDTPDPERNAEALQGARPKGQRISGDAYVKDRLKLYLDTWVLKPLDHLIALEEAKQQRSRR